MKTVTLTSKLICPYCKTRQEYKAIDYFVYNRAGPKHAKNTLARKTMTGLLITEELLESLGATKIGNAWELNSRGYLFSFEKPKPRKGVTYPPNQWELSCPGSAYSHSVDNLSECFGFIANASFASGKEYKLHEIRDALGIGGAIGSSANIITPQMD